MQCPGPPHAKVQNFFAPAARDQGFVRNYRNCSQLARRKVRVKRIGVR
jgi:hypothetical protein